MPNPGFVVHYSTELFGTLLEKRNEAGIDPCASGCLAQSECRGFFAASLRQCSTFRTVHAHVVGDDFVSGVRASKSAIPSAGPGQRPGAWAVSDDVEIFGRVLSRTADSSFDRCKGSCEGMQQCVAYTFSKLQGSCALFGSVNSSVSAPGHVSSSLRNTRN